MRRQSRRLGGRVQVDFRECGIRSVTDHHLEGPAEHLGQQTARLHWSNQETRVAMRRIDSSACRWYTVAANSSRSARRQRLLKHQRRLLSRNLQQQVGCRPG